MRPIVAAFLCGLISTCTLVMGIKGCDYRGMPYYPGPPSGAANLVYATPVGSAGVASLRPLAASDGSAVFLPLGGGAMSGNIALDGITAAANAANYDLSASNGIFKAPTGVNTFGGASNTFSNATTMSSSLILNSNFRPSKASVADTNSSQVNVIVSWTSITAARLWNGSCTQSSGNTTPSIIILKDQSGLASATNTITIQPTSGTIDGSASKVCINSAFGSCRMYLDGVNCFTW